MSLQTSVPRSLFFYRYTAIFLLLFPLYSPPCCHPVVARLIGFKHFYHSFLKIFSFVMRGGRGSPRASILWVADCRLRCWHSQKSMVFGLPSDHLEMTALPFCYHGRKRYCWCCSPALFVDFYIGLTPILISLRVNHKDLARRFDEKRAPFRMLKF